MRFKKVLTLPDIHTPYEINLKPILDFCDDWNPDVVQYLGDTTAAESCNHWKEKHNIPKDIQSVEEDYAYLIKNVLEPFNKAKPKKATTLYHIGNHEDWFYQTMQRDLRAKHKYGIEDNIDLKKYKMKIIPLNGFAQFGYLHFTHGIYANKYHAAKMALEYRKCIVYAHAHDVQSFMIHSPIDQDEKILAQSIGCLCHTNPDYLKGKPNKWVNAFHIAYIRQDGSFNGYTIIITRNGFTAPNGKSYKP